MVVCPNISAFSFYYNTFCLWRFQILCILRSEGRIAEVIQFLRSTKSPPAKNTLLWPLVDLFASIHLPSNLLLCDLEETDRHHASVHMGGPISGPCYQKISLRAPHIQANVLHRFIPLP